MTTPSRSACLHVCAVAALCLLTTWVKAATESEQCILDLEAIPAFLAENDTGGKDELKQWGQAHFDEALAKARQDAAQVQDAKMCRQAINAYLKAWRKGHLSVIDVPLPAPIEQTQTADKPELDPTLAPTIKLLSQKTALLTLPSFENSYRDPLVALLKTNRAALARHPYWIIDVRSNGGGSDSTYYPLLPWLLRSEREDIGAQWLATPANIEGQEQVCALFAPRDTDCKSYMEGVVKRMSSAVSGTYVPQEDGPAISFKRVESLKLRRPIRVAVLVGHQCGSSCEEFLLAARQSFQVKLVGRPSHGSLDYSNVRPHKLPSGERLLLYATSRSNRLPDLPIDVAGVQPDIYLPEPADELASTREVLRVQRWLEQGSLKDGASLPTNH